jgi:hypothetical protein
MTDEAAVANASCRVTFNTEVRRPGVGRSVNSGALHLASALVLSFSLAEVLEVSSYLDTRRCWKVGVALEQKKHLVLLLHALMPLVSHRAGGVWSIRLGMTSYPHLHLTAEIQLPHCNPCGERGGFQ